MEQKHQVGKVPKATYLQVSKARCALCFWPARRSKGDWLYSMQDKGRGPGLTAWGLGWTILCMKKLGMRAVWNRDTKQNLMITWGTKLSSGSIIASSIIWNSFQGRIVLWGRNSKPKLQDLFLDLGTRYNLEATTKLLRELRSWNGWEERDRDDEGWRMTPGFWSKRPKRGIGVSRGKED